MRTVDARPGALLRSAVSAPIRPQTYKNLLYLSLAFPLGIAYLVFASVGYTLGATAAIFVVGIPVLALVVLCSLALAGFERRLARFLLGVDLPDGPGLEGDTRREQVKAIATDLRTWLSVLYLPTKFFVGTAAFVVIVTVFTTGLAMLFTPFYYDQPGFYIGFVTNRPVELHPALYVGWNNLLVGVETVVTVGSYRVTTLTESLVVAAGGVILCLFGLAIVNAMAWATGWYTTLMLRDGFDVVRAVRGT